MTFSVCVTCCHNSVFLCWQCPTQTSSTGVRTQVQFGQPRTQDLLISDSDSVSHPKIESLFKSMHCSNVTCTSWARF